MINAPIKRPTTEEALAIHALTPGERRRLKPGLPVRRFVHPILRTTITTRDGDIYSAAGWTETVRRQAP
jgi:hypothetical protein